MLAIGAACFATGGVMAAEPTRDQLLAEIEALRGRVAALEAGQGERAAQARGPSAQEVDAAVENVLRDADRRSLPLGPQATGTGGYDDEGFYLRSDDGNFTLRPILQFQFRGGTNYRDDGEDGESDIQSGFEVRRLEFSIEGNAFTPALTYEFKWVTERSGGGVVAEDAFVAYEFAKPWILLGGQFRDPVFHEELVSSKYQLAADRSLANAVLASATGFVQGVMLVYGDQDSALHAAAAFHDGAGSINTSFTDTEGDGGFVQNFGLAGRGEYKFFGDWKRYKDFTAKGTDENLLVIGGAFDWTQGDNTDLIFATVDLQWEIPAGLGVYAALLGNYYDFRNGATESTRFDWGGVVQASYMLTTQWEAFARYDLIRLDDDFAVAGDTFHEFTVGANHYFGAAGQFLHRAKFTLDLSYLPNGSPTDATGLGIFAGDEEQWTIRGQFQLLL